MSDVTEILNDLVQGKQYASDALFVTVHNELRLMADRLMRKERSDHTLQTTALINEAYVRLVDHPNPQKWDGRSHFLSAAAESMRRILVDHARRKLGKKRGGEYRKHTLQSVHQDAFSSVGPNPTLIIDVSDALEKLAGSDPQAAEMIRLRFFAGVSIAEAAELVGVTPTEAYANWAYAKARLSKLLESSVES
ncbi:ECF-type sigma factor [Aureliella helgolandensis]|uniref:ECF sigma factor n=1 Tax=Aureliella helgolandensis TaxID=2527968 RepID=A0A518G4Y6_9BACT|nr:ECF-type sigma factor [Aureliella helgolandensis]QDV23609.1 ECF sigma factor [Aureliella helgolandensis]